MHGRSRHPEGIAAICRPGQVLRLARGIQHLQRLEHKARLRCHGDPDIRTFFRLVPVRLQRSAHGRIQRNGIACRYDRTAATATAGATSRGKLRADRYIPRRHPEGLFRRDGQLLPKALLILPKCLQARQAVSALGFGLDRHQLSLGCGERLYRKGPVLHRRTGHRIEALHLGRKRQIPLQGIQRAQPAAVLFPDHPVKAADGEFHIAEPIARLRRDPPDQGLAFIIFVVGIRPHLRRVDQLPTGMLAAGSHAIGQQPRKGNCDLHCGRLAGQAIQGQHIAPEGRLRPLLQNRFSVKHPALHHIIRVRCGGNDHGGAAADVVGLSALKGFGIRRGLQDGPVPAFHPVGNRVIALRRKIDLEADILGKLLEAAGLLMIPVLGASVYRPLIHHEVLFGRRRKDHGIALIGLDGLTAGVGPRILLGPIRIQHLIVHRSLQLVEAARNRTHRVGPEPCLHHRIRAERRNRIDGRRAIHALPIYHPAVKYIAVIGLGTQTDRRSTGQTFKAAASILCRDLLGRIRKVHRHRAVAGLHRQIIGPRLRLGGDHRRCQHRKGIAAAGVGLFLRLVVIGIRSRRSRIIIRIGLAGQHHIRAIPLPAGRRVDLIAGGRLNGQLRIARDLRAGSHVPGHRRRRDVVVVVPQVPGTEVPLQGEKIAVPDKDRVKIHIGLGHGYGDGLLLQVLGGTAHNIFPVAERISRIGLGRKAQLCAGLHHSPVGKALGQGHRAGLFVPVGDRQRIIRQLKLHPDRDRLGQHGIAQRVGMLRYIRLGPVGQAPLLHAIALIGLRQKQQACTGAEGHRRVGIGQLLVAQGLRLHQRNRAGIVAAHLLHLDRDAVLLAADHIGGRFKGHGVVAAVSDAADHVFLSIARGNAVPRTVDCALRDGHHIVGIHHTADGVAAGGRRIVQLHLAAAGIPDHHADHGPEGRSVIAGGPAEQLITVYKRAFLDVQLRQVPGDLSLGRGEGLVVGRADPYGDRPRRHGKVRGIRLAAVADVQPVLPGRRLFVPGPAVVVGNRAGTGTIMTAAAGIIGHAVAAQAVKICAKAGGPVSVAAHIPDGRNLKGPVLLGIFQQLIGPAVAVDHGGGLASAVVIDRQPIALVSAEDLQRAQLLGQEDPVAVVRGGDLIDPRRQRGGILGRQGRRTLRPADAQRHGIGTGILHARHLKCHRSGGRHVVIGRGALQRHRSKGLSGGVHICRQLLPGDRPDPAHLINGVKGLRIGGDQVLLAPVGIPIDHVDPAAIGPLRAVAGGGKGVRCGFPVGHIGPHAVRQLLPLIADALGIVFRIPHLHGNRVGRIRVQRDRALFIQPRQAQFGITHVRLGPSRQDLAFNALVGSRSPHGLDLIIISRIGVQTGVLIFKLPYAVLIDACSERHEGKLIAAGTIREFVITIDLEAGHRLIVAPGESHGVIRGPLHVLFKVRGQLGRHFHIRHQIIDHREGFELAAVVVLLLVGEELPAQAVAKVLGLNGHILHHGGIAAALCGGHDIPGSGLPSGRHAHDHAAGAGAGAGLQLNGAAEAVGRLRAHVNGLRDRDPAAGPGIVDRSPVPVVDQRVLIPGRRAGIGGRIPRRMRQDGAGDLRQLLIVLGNGLILVQLHDLGGRRVGRGHRHGLLGIRAVAVGGIRLILVHHHRDGVQHHRVRAHRGGVFHGLLQGGGLFKIVRKFRRQRRAGLHRGHRNAEHLDVLLEGDIGTCGDGCRGRHALAGAGGLSVRGRGLGIVSGQVIPVQQIREVGRGGQNRQHLGVGIGEVMMPRVLQVRRILVRVGEGKAGASICVGGLNKRHHRILRTAALTTVGLHIAVRGGGDRRRLIARQVQVGAALPLTDDRAELAIDRSHDLRQIVRHIGLLIGGHPGQLMDHGPHGPIAIAEQVCAGGAVFHVEAAVTPCSLIVQRGGQLQAGVLVRKLLTVKIQRGRLRQSVGHDGQVGHHQRQGAEDIRIIPLHHRVLIAALVVFRKQVKVFVGDDGIAVSAVLVNGQVAGIDVPCQQILQRLAAQHQRIGPCAGQFPEGKGRAHDGRPVRADQRELVALFQHLPPVAVQHGRIAAAVIVLVVIAAVGDGQILNAILVKIAGQQRDHVGNILVALGHRMAPAQGPVPVFADVLVGRGAGVGLRLILIDLDPGILPVRHVDGDLIHAVPVKVAGRHMQIILDLELQHPVPVPIPVVSEAAKIADQRAGAGIRRLPVHRVQDLQRQRPGQPLFIPLQRQQCILLFLPVLAAAEVAGRHGGPGIDGVRRIALVGAEIEGVFLRRLLIQAFADRIGKEPGERGDGCVPVTEQLALQVILPGQHTRFALLHRDLIRIFRVDHQQFADRVDGHGIPPVGVRRVVGVKPFRGHAGVDPNRLDGVHFRHILARGPGRCKRLPGQKAQQHVQRKQRGRQLLSCFHKRPSFLCGKRSAPPAPAGQVRRMAAAAPCL